MLRDLFQILIKSRIEETASKLEKQAEKYEKEGIPTKKSSTRLKEKFEADNEWVKSRKKLSNAQSKIQKIKSVAYNSKKSMYEKGLLWVTKAFRAGVLSSYGVVVKLASAIFTGGIIKRIPEQAYILYASR